METIENGTIFDRVVEDSNNEFGRRVIGYVILDPNQPGYFSVRVIAELNRWRGDNVLCNINYMSREGGGLLVKDVVVLGDHRINTSEPLELVPGDISASAAAIRALIGRECGQQAFCEDCWVHQQIARAALSESSGE